MQGAPTILWVEDQADEITAVLTCLRHLGVEIEHVPSRPSAREALDGGGRYSLIVLDEFMDDPEFDAKMSGFELFRELRGGRWGDWGIDVEVVFATKYAPLVAGLLRDTPEWGAEIITKPLTLEDGVNAILYRLQSGTAPAGGLEEPAAMLAPRAEVASTGLIDDRARSWLKAVAQRLFDEDDPSYLEPARHIMAIVAAGNDLLRISVARAALDTWACAAAAHVRQHFAAMVVSCGDDPNSAREFFQDSLYRPTHQLVIDGLRECNCNRPSVLSIKLADARRLVSTRARGASQSHAVGRQPVVLYVHISAPAFGMMSRLEQMHLPAYGDSEPVRFTLVPLKTGRHIVEVELFCGPERIGYITIETEVHEDGQ